MGWISLLFFLVAGVLAAIGLKARSFSQLAIASFVCSAAYVLVSGYALSWMDSIDRIANWALCSIIACLVSAVIMKGRGVNLVEFASHFRQDFRRMAEDSRTALRNKEFLARIAQGFVIVFLIVCIVQVLLVCSFPPTNHDSITYILPRMAQYIQQGNLEYFESNYIAQTVHFKNATVLHIYSFLATGRNEKMIQFVALFSSWIATFSVYGITCIVWGRRIPALLSAIIFSMLTNNLMIAVTPQVDMPITAFTAAGIFFFLSFIKDKQNAWLVLSIVSVAIAFGIKASALLLIPSLAIIGTTGLIRFYRTESWKTVRNGLAIGAASATVAGCVFLINSGYLDNWKRYGHFMGPQPWRQAHSLEDVTVGQRLSIGTTNAARYLVHFISFDGFPSGSLAAPIQSAMRGPLVRGFGSLGLDLASNDHTRQPFQFEKHWPPHEDLSYWGPATLLFIVPGVVWAIVRFHRQPLAMSLIAAGAIYFLAQSYSSLYDPWRGRSFVNLGVFLTPMIGCLFLRRTGDLNTSPGRLYRVTLIGLTTVFFATAINATALRTSTSAKMFFRDPGDRIDQLCRSNSRFASRYKRFEELVPEGSTVLMRRVSPEFAYPIYGEKLNRTILFPGQSFKREDVDFVVFAKENQKTRASDIPLDLVEPTGANEHWYLRKMNRTRLAAEKSRMR